MEGKNTATQGAPAVTVSFLTTEEDFRDFCIAIARLGVGKKEKAACGIFGFLLFCGGLLGAFFLATGTLSRVSWVVLAMVGICFAFYYDKIMPFQIARRAKKEYERNKENLNAQTITVGHEGICVQSVRQKGEYPFSILFRCVKTTRLYIFYFGIGSYRMFPLRLLDEAQQQEVDRLLHEELGERFQMEAGI